MDRRATESILWGGGLLRRRKHAAEIVRRGVLCFFVGFLGHAAVLRARSRSSEARWLYPWRNEGEWQDRHRDGPGKSDWRGPRRLLIEELQYYIPCLGDARGTWRSNT